MQQYIIGIGLSAGGLEPLKEIIKKLDPKLDHTYIILEHHSIDTKNNLKEILSPLTSIYIKEAVDDEIIRPNTIYICPSNYHLVLTDNKIELYKVEDSNFKPSINWFFESLSKYTSKAVAIILSGALNDGTNGLLNIKLNGGLIIAQDPDTAKCPLMPQNAINTDLVDFILSPKDIANTINNLSSLDKKVKLVTLNKIFNILQDEFKINFSDYKEGTILRRIERRMLLNKIKSLTDYLILIENDPIEKKALFNDLLIVVTSFCRDNDSFEALKHQLKEYLQYVDEFKIWEIGCATGEESYSLAMLVHSIIEEENLKIDFKIFATDISNKAINIARAGKYHKTEVISSLPHCHLKYFEKEGDFYIVKKEIRDYISFAPHNILNDIPLTNMDLIVCRNLLIYFKIQSQEKFFKTASYSLKNNGLLFIGKSESLPEKVENLFHVIDAKHKIYKKSFIQQQLFPINYHFTKPKEKSNVSKSLIKHIEEKLNKTLDTFVIIDSYGNILYTSGEFEKYLKIPSGEFNNNIFSFIDDELNLPLHSIISNKTSSINYKIRLKNNKIRYINLISLPLSEFREDTIALFFIPSSNEININTSESSCEEVEHELIETKQKLKYTLEELSTTNEELQTSNEELQSSNEELITTNEELKSVNESLNKTNEELTKYKNELEKLVQQQTLKIEKETKIRSAIFENTNNLIVIIEKNKIIDANKAFLSFFEIQSIENFEYKFNYNKKELSIYQLLIQKSPIKLQIKDKIFLVKISKLDKEIFSLNFIDITIEEEYIKTLKKELKKQIKEIRKRDILLQNEYKLARMGEMLESIAHQYRQPLNKLSLILGQIEMHMDDLSTEYIQSCLTKSNEVIQYLSNTIDDFKNMFQKTNTKTLINLHQFISNTINFIEIDKTIQNINIILDFDKNLNISTYPNELNHILINILHNAKDAIIETKPKNPYIKISVKQKNDDIIIKIKNNGGKIKNKKILFKPYISTKENGSGIGLYLSKIIAKEKLNGKLWAKNKKDGVAFYVRIMNDTNL